jgi:hypothetical protein
VSDSLATAAGSVDQHRRRWFQFRLRTLLLAITALGATFAWFGQQLRLLRGRSALLADVERRGGGYVVATIDAHDILLDLLEHGDVDPPLQEFYEGNTDSLPSLFRRWLGDMPVMEICLPESDTPHEFEQLRGWFPESGLIRLKSRAILTVDTSGSKAIRRSETSASASTSR